TGVPLIVAVFVAVIAAILVIILCFFSSRRRHTIWPRDWSSDVCSSDLPVGEQPDRPWGRALRGGPAVRRPGRGLQARLRRRAGRSEERRVGKEGRSRRKRQVLKKKVSFQ